MFQITILLLYASAGALFAMSRLPRFEASSGVFVTVGALLSASGLIWHAMVLLALTVAPDGIRLSLNSIVSMVGIQLAFIASIGAFVTRLRGLAGGMLLLAACCAALTSDAHSELITLSWQLRAHILISVFAYGLLTVGAIVAVYTLVQDSRLRSGHLSDVNRLFAPLETNELLLYGVAASGFVALLVGVVLGLTFVDDLFAQHLVHKSSFSLLALLLFGTLIGGRYFAGWRGRRAVYLYLWGFASLGLAYFGSRIVLETLLGRSWGQLVP